MDVKFNHLPPSGEGVYILFNVKRAIQYFQFPLLQIYLSAWAAMTKYHRLGGLNNKNLFLTVLKAEKSKIKVLDNPVFGTISCWLAASQSPCSHVAE